MGHSARIEAIRGIRSLGSDRHTECPFVDQGAELLYDPSTDASV